MPRIFEDVHVQPTLNDIREFNLAADEPWEPMFSPYHECIVPAWYITKAARERLQLQAPTEPLRPVRTTKRRRWR